MVKVALDEQATLIAEHPKAFEPEAGAWGLQGCTRVWLAEVNEESLGWALTRACAATKPGEAATKTKAEGERCCLRRRVSFSASLRAEKDTRRPKATRATTPAT